MAPCVEMILSQNNELIKAGERWRLKGQRGFVVWLYGLSGSGKTTIANALDKMLLEKGLSSYLLDGDTLRSGLCSDLNFEIKDRKENLRRASEVAKILRDAGNICLCSFITPLEEGRLFIREILGENDLLEVFVQCSLEECERRDVKGLYEKAHRGEIKNFTGISSPFESPSKRSNQIIVNTEEHSVEDCVDKIINKIIELI